MTDDTDDSEQTADEPSVETTETDEWAQPDAGSDDDTDRNVADYLQWTAFAILILVAVIATLRFYFAASTAISRFLTHQYRPLFQAAFNLALLLACGIGLSLLVRRMR